MCKFMGLFHLVNMIKSPKIHILLLCFVLCIQSATANELDVRFRILNTDDGLSSNQVNSIYKDHKGFLWIGTRSGLNRYDGYNLKVYKNNPSDSTSLIDNFVRKVIGDKNDNLWILSPNSKLCIYDPIKDKFYHSLKQFDKNIKIPQNNISDINIDNAGRVLITNDFFGVYIYDINTGETTWLKSENGNPNSILSNDVSSIKQNSEGDFWIINRQGILEKINSKTLNVEKRTPVFSDVIENDGENFRLFIDSSNDVWVYSESASLGAACYIPSKNRIVRYAENGGDYAIVNNVVKDIVQDSIGSIWIGMDHGGINVIDKKTGDISRVENIKGEMNSLPDNSITSFFTDNTGIIWVGMYKGGLAYYHRDFFKFKLFHNNPYDSKSISCNDINSFAEDRKGNIWIGSNGGGLIYYNRLLNRFDTYKNDPHNTNSISKDVVISLLNDSKNRLWIGTYFGGLDLYNNSRFKHFKHNPNVANSLSNNRVWQVFEDSRNNIWVGTLGGGVDLLDANSEGFIHFKDGHLNSVGSNFIFSIEEDKYGNIWFGTINGIDVLDWESQRFFRYEAQLKLEHSLSDNKVLVIKKDSRGLIWIGTTNGLNLYDENSKTFRVFRQKDGLPDNSILGIEEDDLGNIWVMTPMGLSEIHIDYADDIWNSTCSFHYYNQKDGLEKQKFNERASFKTSSGELLFGGINGFSLINPTKIKSFSVNKDVTLLQFKLFNNPVQINEVVGNRIVLTKSFSATDEITLKHNENIFAISFAALDFFHPEKLVYEYKLEGFNDKWFRVGSNRREATYTNLNSGIYFFRVRVSENGEDWYPHEVYLKINILPPFWASNWAYFSYTIFVVLLLIGWRYLVLKKERIKIKKQNELDEVNRIKELNDLKIKFFTNVSHEFRTPLTLIISPIQKLINSASDPTQIKQLSIIERNGKRLLNLVNQLLDFRKLEVNQLKLFVSSGDIVQFIQEKAEAFVSYSENKGVKLNVTSEVDSYHALFDHDKLEKVIFNLLSNAFKFTLKGGQINVVLKIVDGINEQQRKMLQIEVSDSGIGIEPSKLNSIFDRFFQGEHAKEISNQGSGIGLSLTKEFVHLHGGSITVKSCLGEGSCFSVYIPLDIKGEQIDLEQSENTAEKGLEYIEDIEKVDENVGEPTEKPLLLLVEDNDDLRYYLKENLSNNYRIIEATNGQKACDLLNEELPAVIISDVMMPIMDGIEFCRKIKEDARYSHIPFVLLTAITSLDNELKGLEVGADDYITKPFNYEVLELKIRNIIAHRKSLHSKFGSSLEISPSEICITSMDEKLFKKALDVVNANLIDSEFSIDKMCELMGISRAHLYNKLVGITGKTPAEFIKIMRLKRAAQLLEQSQLTVAEISYEVGYNGPRYFTKHFKDQYGQTPSQYSKSVEPKNNDFFVS